MKIPENISLLPDILKFMEESRFKAFTEVQAKTIPLFLNKESLSVLAQTGTGKTLSFVVPLFHLLKSNDDEIPMEQQIGAPRAIILTPTRELSAQVFKVSKSLAHHCKLRVRQLVGGDKGKQTKRIADEAYDILVGNPGRLLSGLKNGEIKPSMLEVLVLDEADQLLDMGFSKDLLEIQKILNTEFEKNGRTLQSCLYSATWPEGYQDFVQKTFEQATLKEIVLQGSHKVKRSIETFNIYLGQSEKPEMLAAFLNKTAKKSGMVFVNKKEDIAQIYNDLKDKYPKKRFWSLHGGMGSGERKQSFSQFQKLGGILITSDIAARGIDHDEVEWILNYDLPFEAVYYIHRCGRTGRNGREGNVYNFVTHTDSELITRINLAIHSQSSLALKALGTPQKSSQKSSGKTKGTSAKSKKKSASKRGGKTPRYKKKK